ncbi:MAG TPA: transglutaminase domain-containing protein [Fimbriimonadaceae bacterium]|nr:transglutaminase domain-containing protein [Fimbriimonadaceae bacterium]
MKRPKFGVGGKLSGGEGLQPVDLLLTGISSTVAVYAAAASLASDKNSMFFMWIVLAGTLCSSLLLWFFGKTKFIYMDATAYTAVALISALGISGLNNMTPDAIYTGPLIMAGVLSWMLALGSFTVWRDQTMLFQAVPAVALFGLVGCYDTFKASVIYFFAFLICQAILLARAHGRVMLRQARSSGADALEMSVMRKGPWRWMAGPEWALGSALTIVLISVIGAPILRESASGFSGLVRYTPPISPLSQAALTNFNMNGSRIGSGPNSLHETPVLRVEMPEPMYLRGFAYGAYNHGVWMPEGSPNPATDNNDTTPASLVLDTIADRREISFKIEPLQVFNTIVAVPGEVQELVGDSNATYFRNIGDSYSVRSEAPYPPLEGHSIVFGGHVPLRDVEPEMGKLVPVYVQKSGIPSDVAAFAQQVTRGEKTDFGKAKAIQNAIEQTAKYNLDAAAVPPDQDPVSYFLFKQKEGYCDLFASSMTLMARAVGLPARYVTGYYPFNADQDDEGRYIVRQKDAHAWCEIFFKGAGWVIFDATEGAVQVDGAGRGSVNDKPFWRSAWFVMVVTLTLASGLGYLAFLGLGTLRQYRSSTSYMERHVRRASAKVKAQIRRHYVSFERELQKEVRRPRGSGETLYEYLNAARPDLRGRGPEAEAAGTALTAVLYGAESIDPAKLEDLKLKVHQFRKAKRGPKA